MSEQTEKQSEAAPVALPTVMGKQLSRHEVIEAIRECYEDLRHHMRKKDPTFVGYPDYETVLDHIEEHGLPPRSIDE
jgi:hypothetical protein